jgi:2-polyprenyl-3-methyl-5-hydroxy-6-metoxy-1,4-benzoquinol methylase
MVRGTAGYEKFIDAFIEGSQALNFHQVCHAFLEWLPDKPGRILDAGAGAGQNAMALADMGHSVVAVEPMLEFINAARVRYANYSIVWHQDSLPNLTCLDENSEQFDFILADGVWHHLDETERASTLCRFASLLKVSGRCAISLRNGPPGMGALVFATDADCTIAQAKQFGLTCIMDIRDQPSIFSFKKDVFWARLVFEKAAPTN